MPMWYVCCGSRMLCKVHHGAPLSPAKMVCISSLSPTWLLVSASFQLVVPECSFKLIMMFHCHTAKLVCIISQSPIWPLASANLQPRQFWNLDCGYFFCFSKACTFSAQNMLVGKVQREKVNLWYCYSYSYRFYNTNHFIVCTLF